MIAQPFNWKIDPVPVARVLAHAHHFPRLALVPQIEIDVNHVHEDHIIHSLMMGPIPLVTALVKQSHQIKNEMQP